MASLNFLPMDQPSAEHRVRVRVFVDFWNFQLSLNQAVSGFKADWAKLGHLLAREALQNVDETAHLSYQGMNVYGSYGESTRDRGLKDWAEKTLAGMSGVRVEMLPRQRKRRGPRCPSCYSEVSTCPSCGADMRGTEEKGIDTRIATAMISLAWVDNYDVAVLVSSDRDFIPVVDFLETRGIKVVHGAFPPAGSELTRKCWGSIAIPDMRDRFRRT